MLFSWKKDLISSYAWHFSDKITLYRTHPKPELVHVFIKILVLCLKSIGWLINSVDPDPILFGTVQSGPVQILPTSKTKHLGLVW